MEPSIALAILLQALKHWVAGTLVVVLDAPLLFEAGIYKFTYPVIVVWVDRATQEARLMRRDKCSAELAHAKVDAQLSLDWKVKRADIVINNEGDLDSTNAQVQLAWQQLIGPLSWKELLLSRNVVSVMVAGTIVLCFWWFRRVGV